MGDAAARHRCTPRTRLICVPFAGGSPDLFRAWAGRLGDDLELLAVRLPGHGTRMMDRPYTSWAPLIEDTFAALEPYLAEPHFFYGHSFGGRLAYELCQRAAAPYPGMTSGLFLSACRSPDRPQNRPYMHEMSDAGFRSAVREMGGTPGEVLEHKALMRLLLPAIHSEIRLAELWTDRHPRGVDAPIVAMYGRDDPIDGHASMRGWTSLQPDRLRTAGDARRPLLHRHPSRGTPRGHRIPNGRVLCVI